MFSEPSDAGTLKRGRLTYFPVVPGRLEFAIRVRRYILEHRPNLVAVELPASLEDLYRKALDRLPQMSVIVIPDAAAEAHTTRRKSNRHPTFQWNPAIHLWRRSARPANWAFPTSLLEPATQERPHCPTPIRSRYSVEFIGMERYVEAYRVYPQPRTPESEAHAGAMAWKLQGADPSADTLVVVGINLARPAAGCDGDPTG